MAVSSRFEKALKSTEASQKNRAKRALRKLAVNRMDRSLNLEKIRDDVWSIRVDRGWRILLREMSDEQGKFFLASGLANHDIYKKR